ncbi:MAG: tetratricopeptide repeat protein [Pirellulaceae bacterium]|nr:tetratricopeptide repeat protein [Pirellulaceae bacterium]
MPLGKDDTLKLVDHLKEVQDWEGTGSGLLAVYANLLAAQGKRQESLDVMGKAAKKDPSLQSSYSIMARKFNMPKIADESSERARKALQAAIKDSKATVNDYIQLATLELTEENYQGALEVTRTGLNTVGKDSEQLRYLGSEALRLMYRKSVKKTPKGLEFNLGLLDAAMREYPGNPNLTTEIALLDDMGVEAPPAFKAVMEEQLANGKATALAHLVLANQDIKAGRLVDAIPHLELTLKSAPNHPVALNNLSLSLALTDSSKAERAEKLIEQAINIDPRNPEFYDSQGQIRMIAGRPLDAVESLEKAIGIDPNRINTRDLMVKAYRDAGLDDLARAQEKALAQLKLEASKPKEAAVPPTTAPPATAPPKTTPAKTTPPATEPPPAKPTSNSEKPANASPPAGAKK